MEKVIVVGAGILGAATAYHLASFGADVVIVDREEQGRATDVAAGLICPWITQRRNKAWYFLAKNGAAYYPELIQQLEDLGQTETGYSIVGALSIHFDEEKLEKTYNRALQRQESAPEMGEVRLLKDEEARRLFPPLKEGLAAVYVGGAARVNGKALRQALIQAAMAHGAHFVKGDAQLICKNQTVTGVATEHGEFHADHVIVTAGAWADQLLKPLGISLRLSVQKGQIVHLRMENPQTGHWPVVIPPHDQDILPFDHGKVIVGATHEDEAGFDYRVTAAGVNDVLTKALNFAPGLADATVENIHVGFRPYTPESLPVIGTIPGYEGLYYANGLGSSGLTVGPYLGRELAKFALGLELTIDLKDYDIRKAIE